MSRLSVEYRAVKLEQFLSRLPVANGLQIARIDQLTLEQVRDCLILRLYWLGGCPFIFQEFDQPHTIPYTGMIDNTSTIDEQFCLVCCDPDGIDPDYVFAVPHRPLWV